MLEITWTLVLVGFTSSATPPQIHHIPGFASEAACLKAEEKIRQRADRALGQPALVGTCVTMGE